jgi:hypothetical protein
MSWRDSIVGAGRPGGYRGGLLALMDLEFGGIEGEYVGAGVELIT